MKGNTRGEGRIHLFEKDGGQIPNKTKMGGVLSKTCDRGRGASRVSIRITFAQFCKKKTQIFGFVVLHLRENCGHFVEPLLRKQGHFWRLEGGGILKRVAVFGD